MQEELYYLIEKIEELETKIALILDDGYKEHEIKELIHEHKMLENILNAMILNALSK